jgi:predicted RNase H-like HicB family nuclease
MKEQHMAATTSLDETISTAIAEEAIFTGEGFHSDTVVTMESPDEMRVETMVGWAVCLYCDPDDEDGWYTIEAMALPGIMSQGSTRDEAIENIKEAISLALEAGLQPAGAIRHVVPAGGEITYVAVALPD